jgi:O-antigen ligase
MTLALSSAAQRAIALAAAASLLLGSVLMPERMLTLVPLLVLGLAALAFYQFPRALAAVLVLTCGFGLDIQADAVSAAGGGAGGALGALVKLVPFALAGALLLRYGPSPEINWPFITFIAIAGLSIAILPIGRIATNADMVRSFIGSTAPFALGFALAPRRVWTLLIRGAAVVPLISALVSVLTTVAGIWPSFDVGGRFQGLHTPPFLGGFCVTAIFAATLEYLRGFKLQWLIIGGLDLGILLLTQARAPLIAAALFLFIIFVFSSRKIFPLQRKVDLAMGGMIPGLVALGPALYFAFDRVAGMSNNMSGRDIIWPYFIEAIQARPFFGFGLGAGKLIVNPEDPTIKLLGSNAAHNEYLRLSVDAGIVGCAAIFLSIILWIWSGANKAPPADRMVLRAGLLAALVHSGFDNTLIASTALMQFSFFYAAMARAKVDAREMAPRRARHGRRQAGPEEGVMSAALARQARG